MGITHLRRRLIFCINVKYPIMGSIFWLLFAGLIPTAAISAEWTTSAGLRVGETYTDNVRLEEQDEESDFSTVVTPNFSVKGSGARANLDILASLQLNTVGGDTDNFNPQLRANADIELVENFFFIDFDASARQTAIDPFRANGSTSLDETGNSTTTYQYGVTPYISSRIRDFASYELRYNFDDQLNSEREIDDSSRDSASFHLRSGAYFGRVSWGVSGNYSRTIFDDNAGNVSTTESSDNEFISTNLNLGYRFDRKWRLAGNIGKEWNDFVSADNDTGGDSWSAELAWTPNKRATVNLSYGERFFGKTPALDITYSHKKSTFTLGYSRAVTDTRSVRQLGDTLSDLDEFGRLVTPFPGDVLLQSANLTSLRNSTLVDERLDFSYSLRGKRSSISLDGSRSKQASQESGIEGIFSRYSVMADRSLSSNFSVNLGYTWDEREEGVSHETANTNRYTLGMTKSLGPKTSLSLNYSFVDRNSDRIDDDYSQNRINLFLSVTF